MTGWRGSSCHYSWITGFGLAALLWPAVLTASDGLEGPVPLGAREVAMGGAGVAGTENVLALEWNPAGLAALDRQEVTGSRTELFDSGLRLDHLAAALPLARGRAIGFGWSRLGYDDDALRYAENRLTLGFGSAVVAGWSAGGTMSFLSRSIHEDDVDSGQGTGFSADLGVRGTPLPGVSVGLAARNLGQTALDYDEGASSAAYEQSLRGGVDWEPFRDAHLAFQIDDQWHVGGEWLPVTPIAMRGGYRQAIDNAEDHVWSIGAGVNAGVLRFDYAREMHPVLNDSQHFALMVRFQFNPSLVQIEEATMDELFVSLFRSYGENGPAHVRLRNRSDEAIEAKLAIEIPGLTNLPFEKVVILRPGVVTSVDVPLRLGEASLQRRGDTSVEAQVVARYDGARSTRRETRSLHGTVYGRGAIDWDKGLGQAAAFVTYQDPVIDSWARGAVAGLTRPDTVDYGSGQSACVAALITGLRRHGVRYVPDPLNPYSSLASRSRAVDSVRYPRETLAAGSGDCDDTSILLIALLQNLGIESRLVDVPGHLLILADSGIHVRHRAAFDPQGDLTIEAEGRLWLPIETTELGNGFAAAWASGADVIRASPGGGALVNLRAFEASYPPPALPEGPGTTHPAPGLIANDLREQASLVRAHRDASRFRSRPVDSDSRALVSAELARIEWRAGRLTRALGRLETLLGEAGSRRRAALINMAIVAWSAGRSSDARDAIETVLRESPGDATAVRLAAWMSHPRTPAMGEVAAVEWQEVYE